GRAAGAGPAGVADAAGPDRGRGVPGRGGRGSARGAEHRARGRRGHTARQHPGRCSGPAGGAGPARRPPPTGAARPGRGGAAGRAPPAPGSGPSRRGSGQRPGAGRHLPAAARGRGAAGRCGAGLAAWPWPGPGRTGATPAAGRPGYAGTATAPDSRRGGVVTAFAAGCLVLAAVTVAWPAPGARQRRRRLVPSGPAHARPRQWAVWRDRWSARPGVGAAPLVVGVVAGVVVAVLVAGVVAGVITASY